MKKHRRFTKQISDGFLARKALTYWRNLIANYDENVSDRDFFDNVGAGSGRFVTFEWVMPMLLEFAAWKAKCGGAEAVGGGADAHSITRGMYYLAD